jgi:hypothetical protein
MHWLYSKISKFIKAGLCLFLITISFSSHAQVFWTENFGTGCSQGNTANGYSGTNGTWSVVNTGTNDAYANAWYVSATEAGMGSGNCGDGCGGNPSLINRTLHLGPSPSLGGDAGATYNAGGICGLGICVLTDQRAESPVISCHGYDTISVSFNYFMQGSAGADFAALAFYDGASWSYYNGTSWTATFTSIAPTNNASCAGQGLWTAYSAQLPPSANNNSAIKIGFRWINNDDGAGTDPSFAVDDITLSGTAAPSCSVAVIVNQPVLCYDSCNGTLTVIGFGVSPFHFHWSNGDTTATSLNLCGGMYTVVMTDSVGCMDTANFIVTEPPALVPGNPILNDPTCIGCTDGSICLGAASGGTPNYSYTISPNATFNGNCFISLPQGVYTVCVTDANGCIVCDDDTLTDPPMNVTDQDSPVEIRMYPNPFHAKAIIEVYGLQFTHYRFVIRDAVGREIGKYEISNHKTEISRNGMQAGIYFFDLLDDKDKVVHRGRFIVQ